MFFVYFQWMFIKVNTDRDACASFIINIRVSDRTERCLSMGCMQCVLGGLEAFVLEKAAKATLMRYVNGRYTARGQNIAVKPSLKATYYANDFFF